MRSILACRRITPLHDGIGKAGSRWTASAFPD